VTREAQTTVVVPTWQRAEWLHKCLSAVLRQDPAPGSVLVVVRAEDSAARSVIDGFAPHVRWTLVEKPGHVAPIRAAMTEVRTPYVAFLDDDAEPIHSDWLRNLLATFDDPRAGWVGSQVRTPDGGTFGRVRRHAGQLRWYGRIVGNVGGRQDDAPVEVAALPEGNSAWRTDLLRSLTLDAIWDLGDASMYGLELGFQVRRSGYRVLFNSLAPVYHYDAPRGSIAREDRAGRVHAFARNMTYIALKHFGWKAIPFFIWSTLVGDSTMFGLASGTYVLGSRRERWATVRASARGRVDGVAEWRRFRSSSAYRRG
jgi:GT2 family glycosyltransferase